MTSENAIQEAYDIGMVIIGRNEGQRLINCLASIDTDSMPTVYVDSGSTDNSQAVAKYAGCNVVALDLSQPFTAGRARNLGFEALIRDNPQLKYIQFMDGDCQMDRIWLRQAHDVLSQKNDVAIVCGRRREMNPTNSIYNRLCDIEWNTPIGDAEACGGDFMIRVDAFESVDGFNPSVIAGEEPEMCLRIRRSGWKIERIDAEMTLHDADMNQFRQFARRCERSGHAYAQGVAMHGNAPEKFQRRQLFGLLFWGAALPVLVLLLALAYTPLSLLLLLAYPAQWLKISIKSSRRMQLCQADAQKYSAFIMVGKFFQSYGALKYFIRSCFSRDLTIIEYK